jgi:hypothetical protein
MIILALFGMFYLIPMLFLWLALRRAYQSGSMSKMDVEDLFPLTLVPLLNSIAFFWILKELLFDAKLYSKFVHFIIGEKK